MKERKRKREIEAIEEAKEREREKSQRWGYEGKAKREKLRENTVASNGTGPGQRSRNSNGTVPYLPDRRIDH